MALGADHHGDRGCTEETLRLDVPPCVQQQRITGCGEAGGVGDGGAAHEDNPAAVRELEEVDEPGVDDVVELGGDRRHDGERRVLVPRGGEPGRRQRRGLGAAGDEPEVGGPGVRDGPRAAGGVEQPEDVSGVGAAIGEGLVERSQPREGRVVGCDGPLVDRRGVGDGPLGC